MHVASKSILKNDIEKEFISHVQVSTSGDKKRLLNATEECGYYVDLERGIDCPLDCFFFYE